MDSPIFKKLYCTTTGSDGYRLILLYARPLPTPEELTEEWTRLNMIQNIGYAVGICIGTCSEYKKRLEEIEIIFPPINLFPKFKDQLEQLIGPYTGNISISIGVEIDYAENDFEAFLKDL